METLAEQLARQTREAALYRPLDRGAHGARVECFACGHRCSIAAGLGGDGFAGSPAASPPGFCSSAIQSPREESYTYHPP